MIKEDCIALDDPAAWRAALQGIKHAFAHTWENCYAMHLTTGYHTYLYTFEMENVRIVCPVAERPIGQYIDIVNPYGFAGFVGTGDCAEFPVYWQRFMRRQGYVCGYIGLNPVFANETYLDPAELYQSNAVYLIDLTRSLEELHHNLAKSRRAQLRNWEQFKENIVLEKSVVTTFFLDHYLDFFHDKNASSVYHFSDATLSFLTSLENLLIIGAGNAGTVEAVSVFVYTPHGGDYLFNISLPTGRQHAAPLLWYGIHELKSRGVPLLNLGGGVREEDGIAHFKERFGGEKLPLRALKQIYQPELYEQLCRQHNVDPTEMDGYFPAYRRP